MKKLTTLLLMMAATIIPSVAIPSVATAAHSPLYKAADAYRDAVVEFERQVIRSGAYDRYDVRLVDALEDSTSVLRSASRDPLSRRFESAFDEVGGLQDRVASSLFARGCPRSASYLTRYWQSVNYAYVDLIKELRCELDRHGPATPPVYAPAPNYAPLPNVTVPNVAVPRVNVPFPNVVPNQVAPQVNAPYPNFPNTAVPNLIVPNSTVPHVTAPRYEVPTLNGPITTPQQAVPEYTEPSYESFELNPITPPLPTVVPEVRYSAPQPLLPGTVLEVPAQKSLYVNRTRTRTVARPALGYSRDVQVDREYEHRRDLGAAIVGAVLSRMLQ